MKTAAQPKFIAIVCNELVAVEMAALKTGTRSATSCNQLPSSK